MSSRLLHQVEHALPARFGEEVAHHCPDEPNTVREIGLLILIRRGFERPVNEHRTPDDILFRNESPVTAVVTYIAIVAHSEIAVGWHHEVAIFDVAADRQTPLLRGSGAVHRSDTREIVAIRVVITLAVNDV